MQLLEQRLLGGTALEHRFNDEIARSKSAELGARYEAAHRRSKGGLGQFAKGDGALQKSLCAFARPAQRGGIEIKEQRAYPRARDDDSDA
jgi:hypothetical protein